MSEFRLKINSGGAAYTCAASTDSARALRTHGALTRREWVGFVPRNDADARGSIVAPAPLKNHLVPRQIQDSPAKTPVLHLKLLHALHRIGHQTSVLPAPTGIRHIAHPNSTDCIRHTMPLRHHHIDLVQFLNELFGIVTLPGHERPLVCSSTTSG